MNRWISSRAVELEQRYNEAHDDIGRFTETDGGGSSGGKSESSKGGADKYGPAPKGKGWAPGRPPKAGEGVVYKHEKMGTIVVRPAGDGIKVKAADFNGETTSHPSVAAAVDHLTNKFEGGFLGKLLTGH